MIGKLKIEELLYRLRSAGAGTAYRAVFSLHAPIQYVEKNVVTVFKKFDNCAICFQRTVDGGQRDEFGRQNGEG